MEIENFDNLLLDPNNPRTIGVQEFDDLKASLTKFGDLGGFIFNVTTGQLVGGHQRKQALEAMGGLNRVVITHTLDAPNKQGTIAIGHIEHDGELYAYRKVQWTPAWQRSANIAANRIGGTFDLEKLARQNYELLQEDPELLKLTGQTEDELKSLLASTGVVDAPAESAPQEPPRLIRIECQDDQQMTDLYNELKDRPGLRVKLT